MKNKKYLYCTLILSIFFLTASCSPYTKPNLYKLDINDPDFEKKARFNETQIEKAKQENERKKDTLDFWFNYQDTLQILEAFR